MATSKQLRDAANKAKAALDKANKAALAANTPAARKKAKADLALAQKNHTAATRAVSAGANAGNTAPVAGGLGEAVKKATPLALGGALGGGLLINQLNNNDAASTAAAPKSPNTAVDPSKVTVNPSTVKKQAETETPQQQSGSGDLADGRRPENTPATEGGLGANATNEADRKANLAKDPNSSGRAWGIRQGGKYADATGRATSPNGIAAGQAAYMNQYGLATARQHSMDFEAQMQDKNSPAFMALDRTMGGELTRRMEWQEKNVREPIENKKLVDGVSPEQRAILSKFNSTGEGPEPKFKVYGETPAEQVKAQASSPAGDDTDAYAAAQAAGGAEDVKAQAGGTGNEDFDAFLADLTAENPFKGPDEEEEEEEVLVDEASTDSEIPDESQSTADMVLGGMFDGGGMADEAMRAGSSVKQYGVGKTLTGGGNLAGLQGPAAGIMDKIGRFANRTAAVTNVAGGLTDAWDELTGTDGSLIAGMVSKGESFGTATGNKGRRANAWGGNGLASRAAGGAEAFLNGISGGGYDAMRANIYGGDEYVKQRGGKIEKDPLNAGKFAEWASGALFKKWDDYQNRKSVASTRSQVAANTRANAKRA